MARTKTVLTPAEVRSQRKDLKSLVKKLNTERKDLIKLHNAAVADAQAPVKAATKAHADATKALAKAAAAAQKAHAGLVKKHDKAIAASDKGLSKVNAQLEALEAASEGDGE